ncbi:MAG: hypothetical protein PHV68_05420 [Candidatus Gastranaerophilales bacterium]|nr:hypothetical protein [Candidatus Gastranaerophilales bacterium]
MPDITPSTIFMISGFLLALYSCVSNDVIQTLGTFLSSNEKRPWWIIWAFTSLILVLTLTYGWCINNGDLAFGRLDQIPYQGIFHWWHVLPPIILLILTRFGMPVSTTFLLLSVFSSNVIIGKMILKSFMGYIVAFVASIVLYTVIAKPFEKKFLKKKLKKKKRMKWVIIQWLTTGFLWSQWIMQDVANMFVYLPRKIDVVTLIVILLVFVAFLALLCFFRGGEIQKIVKLKTNTEDIRAASFINIIFGFILMYFKQINNIPMSTSWVFVGLLAGREIALYTRLKHRSSKKMWKNIGKDFIKVTAGLAISVLAVVFILNINWVETTWVEIFNGMFNK